MKTFRAVQRKVLDSIPERACYARNVVRGLQNLSGSDLRGRAKFWGASYSHQRRRAIDAWICAGGEEIQVEHGRRVLAVAVCTDDYGRAVYDTGEGPRYVVRDGSKLLQCVYA